MEEYETGEQDAKGNPVMGTRPKRATRSIPGVFSTRFACVCGAALNCFTNIVAFHPPSQG